MHPGPSVSVRVLWRQLQTHCSSVHQYTSCIREVRVRQLLPVMQKHTYMNAQPTGQTHTGTECTHIHTLVYLKKGDWTSKEGTIFLSSCSQPDASIEQSIVTTLHGDSPPKDLNCSLQKHIEYSPPLLILFLMASLAPNQSRLSLIMMYYGT